jgi:hypothetical protein
VRSNVIVAEWAERERRHGLVATSLLRYDGASIVPAMPGRRTPLPSALFALPSPPTRERHSRHRRGTHTPANRVVELAVAEAAVGRLLGVEHPMAAFVRSVGASVLGFVPAYLDACLRAAAGERGD